MGLRGGKGHSSLRTAVPLLFMQKLCAPPILIGGDWSLLMQWEIGWSKVWSKLRSLLPADHPRLSRTASASLPELGPMGFLDPWGTPAEPPFTRVEVEGLLRVYRTMDRFTQLTETMGGTGGEGALRGRVVIIRAEMQGAIEALDAERRLIAIWLIEDRLVDEDPGEAKSMLELWNELYPEHPVSPTGMRQKVRHTCALIAAYLNERTGYAPNGANGTTKNRRAS